MNPNDARGEQPICRRCRGPIQRQEPTSVGSSWIARGLTWIGAGMTAVVTAPIAPIAIVGGLAVVGGATAVAGGVGVSILEAVGVEFVRKCPECGNALQRTTEDENGPDIESLILGSQNESRTPPKHAYSPVYKCKRQEFKLGDENKVIPKTIGDFVSRFDNETYAELLKDASELDTWKPKPDSLLLIENLDKKMESASVHIQMQALHDWLARCDETFIRSLEDKYEIVIQSTDKEREVNPHLRVPQVDGPDDMDRDSYGFARDDIEVETDLGEQSFRLLYSNSNITTFPADAIVNSCTPDLDFSGQLARQIAREAGSGMLKECQDFIRRNGPLNTGQVFASNAGNLDFEYILHPASPTRREHGANFGPNKELGPNKYLVETAKNILAKADELGLRELALPAISAGGFGFSMDVSLLSIYTGINEYSKNRQGKRMLKDVTLVDINKKLIQEVKNAMVKVFGDDKVLDKETVKQRNVRSVTCKIIGAKKEVLEHIIKKLADKCKGISSAVIKEPATWSPMVRGERYRLEELSTNSVDFIQIQSMFTESIKGVQIQKIERIQYPDLYKGMMDFKHKIIIPDNKGTWKDEFEKKLWHGTSVEGAKNIKKDTFRKAYSKTGAYGKGLYFGSEPSVSHRYTSTGWTDNLRYMFRCTVMVGNIVKFGDKGSSTGSTKAPSGYHTVLACGDKYYVVFDEAQVCPDYLITFTS